jgi:unsaturated rhamnogalacturonyl hydrolase
MAAAVEMEMLETLGIGKGKVVMLDSYFNSEKKKDITGIEKSWHYKWNEKSNSGFSLLGNVFNTYGANTKTLYEAPIPSNLSKADVYIIVDADNVADNPKPNYMTEQYAQVIYDWVKKGGVLLLFHNDKGNCDFEHLNILARKLGFQFNEDCRNKVDGKQFEMGALYIDSTNNIFKNSRKVYLKEISTINIFNLVKTIDTRTVYTDKKDVIMALSTIGINNKAVTVFAVGDPWLYNEYVDGRRLPAEFENFKAANDLVKWALNQSQKAKVKNKK